MEKKPNITDLLKEYDYSADDLVEFFGSNLLIGSGAVEIAKASIIGHNIGKSIMSELTGLLPSVDSEVKHIEPYRNSLVLVNKDSEEYKTALSNLGMILSTKDVYKVVSTLKTRGVCLAGKAGIGKGIIANNIGAEIVWGSDYYESYANLVVSCASSINPNNVTWGTGMNNVEVLGAVYTASKFAKDNPKTAVVLVLDEILECDWKSVLGKSMEFFSDKTRCTSATMTNGEVICYEPNLYVLATGNAGTGYNRGSFESDERYATRFVYVPLTGLFESEETITTYLEYVKTIVSDDKFVFIESALMYVFGLISDIGSSVSRTVSLRALNASALTCDSYEDFLKSVYMLFTKEDRKVLGVECL